MNRLASIDIETTGVRIATDRIVQIGISYIGEETPPIDILINPECPIPAEATECHGITNEAVANAPTFGDVVDQIHAALLDCDLVGFNLLNFDVPLLWEEFYRHGIRWNLQGVNIIDVGSLFKKLNPRTLAAAVKHYCDREHADAHSAIADASATADVLLRMFSRHTELVGLTRDQLAKESRFDERIDLAGMLVRGPDGRPTYNIGKAKGKAVADDPGFGHWMLGKDFPTQTLCILRGLLCRRSIEPEEDLHPFSSEALGQY